MGATDLFALSGKIVAITGGAAAEGLSAIPYDEAALERIEAEQAMEGAGAGAPRTSWGPAGRGELSR